MTKILGSNDHFLWLHHGVVQQAVTNVYTTHLCTVPQSTTFESVLLQATTFESVLLQATTQEAGTAVIY
jgi:hypothetical protein